MKQVAPCFLECALEAMGDSRDVSKCGIWTKVDVVGNRLWMERKKSEKVGLLLLLWLPWKYYHASA